MGQAEDSILQVCQLTELKQTKEWERYPNQFRHLYETLLPENLGKHCWEWPEGQNRVRDQASYSRKWQTQDLIVYTDGSVTKDQSGWGFTVKQGATTIPEGNAAYTGSTSSLTVDVEAVTHAFCWIAPRGESWTIILTDSVSLLQKVEWGNPDWNVSVVDSHLRKLLWLYCPGHARVKGNDQADRLAGKSSHASRKIWSVEELETLPASHHQSPGREVWKEEALDIFLEWTRESHCQSNKDLELFQRWFGETSEMGWSTYGLFQAHRYHLELNWYKILVTK